ncbi:MAG TPA: tetratricopeptide repeat protein, partial [Gemmataceae bacterium]|nr:tetratricopeptide repeat protein [Gemmataceae bacterium]
CLSSGRPAAPGLAAVGGDPSAPEKLELPPPDGAKACLATAELLEKDGKLLEAAALYERARALDPANEAVTRRLAVLYDCQGAFVRADAEYDRALAAAPGDADLWNDFGYSHYCRGNWDRAEQAYRKAVELKPDHKRAWVNLGLALAQQGRPEESFDAFTKVVPAAQAHCNLGFVLAARGKTGDAMHEYRRALELSPDLAIARAALVKLDAPRPAKKAAVPEAKPVLKPEPVAVTDPIQLPE